MQIKIMTFNTRISGADDGINCFQHRKPLILDVISQHAPHLIGFQEVTDETLSFLRENISNDYEIIACGREKNYHGESVAIAYRRLDFTMIKAETFWLSPTPDIPGTTYGIDQSSCLRITTYAVLKPENLDTPIVFANTHFDHVGETAKLFEAEQMLGFFEKINYPVFFTGDFNARPDSLPIAKISEKMVNLTNDIGGTFHAYGKEGYEPVQIDYIFTTAKLSSSVVRTVKTKTENGIYPSDHYPVLATVEY